MRLLVLSALVVHAAALYMTAFKNEPESFETTPTVTVFDNVQSTLTTSLSIPVTDPPSSIQFSALMTIAPLSPNQLELRQRCFDDRGFSVNCAQWTGYYYTWGGAGHPYAGGPGDGGGSGNSNRANSAASHIGLSRPNGLGLRWSLIAVLAILGLYSIL